MAGVKKINTHKTRQRDQNPNHSRPRSFSQSYFRCYGNHHSDTCRFLMEKCRACGRPGHIQRACQTNPATLSPKHDHKVRKTKVNELNVEEKPIYLLKVNAVGGIRGAIWVHPNTNEKLLPMELDTGSAISVINEETYNEKFSDVNLTDTNINLNTYLGESIAQLGVFTVTVDLNDKKKT